MIIILDGKEYAVGLNWFAITSADEAQQFQKEMELTHGILKFNKDPALPSTVALAGSEYEGQVSLAGILSYVHSNLIYVAKTGAKNEAGETLYYLCTVKNSAVSVEGDVIADLETIKALYLANLAELTSEIELSEIQRFGTEVSESEFEGVELIDFDVMLDPARRYAGQCIVKVLAKQGLSTPAIAMIVVLFVLGGYLSYSWLFKKPPPPPVVVAPEYVPRPAPVKETRDPYEVFLEQFANRLSSAPEPEVVPDIIAAVKQVPLINGGWSLNSISFKGNNTESLNLSFTRAAYSNVNEIMDLSQMGYFTNVSVDQEGNKAVAKYPLALMDVPYIEMDTIEALQPGSEEVYYNVISTLQSYDLKFSINNSQGNPYFAENNFNMTGSGLWSLQRTAGILAKFNSLGLTTIDINVQNGNYNWTIEGIIYG